MWEVTLQTHSPITTWLFRKNDVTTSSWRKMTLLLRQWSVGNGSYTMLRWIVGPWLSEESIWGFSCTIYFLHFSCWQRQPSNRYGLNTANVHIYITEIFFLYFYVIRACIYLIFEDVEKYFYSMPVFGLRVLSLHACVCVSFCLSVCVRQSRVCLRNNSSTIKARVTKFGPEM